jgi:hypothetical protein
MSGAIPRLPNTPSWRGAQLKHRDNFTFTFFFCSCLICGKSDSNFSLNNNSVKVCFQRPDTFSTPNTE